MTRDASLDEFLGGEDAEPGDDDTEPGDGAASDDVAGDDVAATSEADDEAAATDAEGETAADGDATAPLSPDAVDPAASTYDWSPDGADCAACGATVERRWRDDPGLVCADCKEW